MESGWENRGHVNIQGQGAGAGLCQQSVDCQGQKEDTERSES